DHPEEKVPGRSPSSTESGESFNDFKQRFIGKLMVPLMEAHAQDPRSKIGIISHLRDVLAAKSWVENGAPKNLEFNHHDVTMKPKPTKRKKSGAFIGFTLMGISGSLKPSI